MESDVVESTPAEQSGVETEAVGTAEVESSGTPETFDRSVTMNEFYGLQRSLLVTVLGTSAVVFAVIWATYSLNIALNYFLGAGVGILYLRMLAKDVEKLGVSKNKLGKARLLPLLVVVVAATQIDRLELLPVILGFLTYKAVLFIYALSAAIVPDP
jgi:ATP synthase protein I